MVFQSSFHSREGQVEELELKQPLAHLFTNLLCILFYIFTYYRLIQWWTFEICCPQKLYVTSLQNYKAYIPHRRIYLFCCETVFGTDSWDVVIKVSIVNAIIHCEHVYRPAQVRVGCKGSLPQIKVITYQIISYINNFKTSEVR